MLSARELALKACLVRPLLIAVLAISTSVGASFAPGAPLPGDLLVPTNVDSPLTPRPAPRARADDPIEALVTRLDFDLQAYHSISQELRPVMEGFPLSGQWQVTLQLERFSVTGPGTSFIVGTAQGDWLVDPPEVALFKGTVAGHPDSHVFLGLSPHGCNGMIEFAGREFILAAGSSPEARSEQLHVVYDRHQVPFDIGEPWRCFTDQLDQLNLFDDQPTPQVPGSRQECTVKQIDLAIESDYEYRTLFGSSAAAQAYAEELLGAVSTIYERDVQTVIFLPYIRVWDADTDPYPSGSTPSQRLSQFRNYWRTNMGLVTRDVAQMLSAVPGGGVAYLGTLCSTNYGYSVAGALNGYFPNPIVSPHGSNWDLVVSAHELGHNCSSPHTHCYDPPLDQCYNTEGGCWSGPRVCSQGTIMSYCHLCAGGLWNIDIEFHTGVQDHIRPYIESRACIGCAGVGVSDESPNRGSTIGALPEVAVTFNQPVTGVAAGDLTVNGSPAGSLTGSDQGPYTFAGFDPPDLGTVTVVLAAGSIVGTQTGDPFEGDGWTYELVADCNGNAILDTLEDPEVLFFNLGETTGVLDTTAPVAQDVHFGGVGDALLSDFNVYYHSTGSTPGVMTVRFWENDLLDATLPGAPLGLIAEYAAGQLGLYPPGGSLGIVTVQVDPFVTLLHNLWVEVEISQQAGVILRAGPTSFGFTHGKVYDRDARELLPGGPHLMGLRVLGVLCPSDCNANDIPDDQETDTDGDDLIDDCDECDADPAKLEPGYCGCGQPETDSDGDQMPDCVDQCPDDPDVQVTEAEDPDLGKCDDGIDNDCDGLTDGDDPDCQAPGCTCGDLDRSGGPVNLSDFGVFALCYQLSSPTANCDADELACSDLDGSGVVDLSDFGVFALVYGQTSTNTPPDCP